MQLVNDVLLVYMFNTKCEVTRLEKVVFSHECDEVRESEFSEPLHISFWTKL